MESLWVFELGFDFLETSKRRAMFYNILSQIFIVKCFTKSLLIRKRTIATTFNCTFKRTITTTKTYIIFL